MWISKQNLLLKLIPEKPKFENDNHLLSVDCCQWFGLATFRFLVQNVFIG